MFRYFIHRVTTFKREILLWISRRFRGIVPWSTHQTDMHPRHREKINACCNLIASRVNMNSLWPKLMENGIFTENNPILEYWLPSLNELVTKKEIIHCIKVAKMENAYYKFLMSLRDCGYQNEADQLEGFMALPPDAPQSSDVLDMSRETNENVNEEQQKDREERNEPGAKVIQPLVARVQNIEHFRSVMHPSQELGIYEMRSDPRGLVLVMTNIFYENYGKREGAEADHAKLVRTFKQLGFKVYECRFDLTAQEMKEKVEQFSKRAELMRVDSAFVIISGHGDQSAKNGDVILGCDYFTKPKKARKHAMVSISELLQFFTDENCPQLKDKPKVFVFQACRGPLEQRSRDEQLNEKISQDGVPSDRITSRSVEQKPREYDDILIAHSTLRGYKSNRCADGSLFLQTFCEVLGEKAEYYPIHDLFSLVDKRIKERYKGISQTPSYEYIGFNKHLYMNPGLTKKC